MVELENLHITLTFLGELGAERIGQISQTLDLICQTTSPFSIQIGGVQAIPSERYFRVLALQVESDPLEQLMAKVKRQIGGKVAPPHLTLGRVKGVRNRSQVVAGLRKLAHIRPGQFTVKTVELIQSILRDSGPVYRTLHVSRLTP
jgi:2'-5' RNA ligase